MAVEDDFSFPTAIDAFSRCGIDSPPLWRLSPAASPISYRQKTASDRNFRDTTGDAEKTDQFASVRFTASLQRRRRFSSDAAADGGEDEAAAEKMDVLWENFNEELSRSRRSKLKKSAEMESMEEIGIVKTRRRMAELNLSETSGAVATTRKATGKTAIVKVLKKLFLMHNNSRRNLQTRPR